MQCSIIVVPKKELQTGAFVGLVNRCTSAPSLGGALQITNNRLGSYTGRLNIASRVYPVRGYAGENAAEVLLRQSPPQVPLRFRGSFDPGNPQQLAGYVVYPEGEKVAIDMRRAVSGAGSSFLIFSGYHTASLRATRAAADGVPE